ncbi:hypothetical protein Tco_0724500 [Tanacetum coccineum]
MGYGFASTVYFTISDSLRFSTTEACHQMSHPTNGYGFVACTSLSRTPVIIVNSAQILGKLELVCNVPTLFITLKRVNKPGFNFSLRCQNVQPLSKAKLEHHFIPISKSIGYALNQRCSSVYHERLHPSKSLANIGGDICISYWATNIGNKLLPLRHRVPSYEFLLLSYNCLWIFAFSISMPPTSSYLDVLWFSVLQLEHSRFA